MTDFNFRVCLFLILVKYYPNFRNDYDLIKVLSWHFGIFDSTEVSKPVRDKALVNAYLDEHRVHHYSITDAGESYLNKHARGAFITAFDERYPQPSDIAKKIRDNYLQSMLDEKLGN